MSDALLEQLKASRETARKRRNSLSDRFHSLADRTNKAFQEMKTARDELDQAREVMNREYENWQSQLQQGQAVWDEYKAIRDSNNAQYDSLRAEADSEHYAMQQCFEQASYAYESGDKAGASAYAQEGHMHQDRRNDLNDQVRMLGQEVKDAKARAQSLAPRADKSAFTAARDNFQAAKSRYHSIRDEFNQLKDSRDAVKSELQDARHEFERLRDECNARREALQQQRHDQRQATLQKAGVYGVDEKDAKIKQKFDGTTHVYTGGIGAADGAGHGHAVIDSSGQTTYNRPAFAAHGHQNYEDEKTGWTPRTHGFIGDRPVTFREGTGANRGQTLISDGHLSKREFQNRHNHYGKNDRDRYPDEPEFIEDSSKHKDDDYYHGPGH